MVFSLENLNTRNMTIRLIVQMSPIDGHKKSKASFVSSAVDVFMTLTKSALNIDMLGTTTQQKAIVQCGGDHFSDSATSEFLSFRGNLMCIKHSVDFRSWFIFFFFF